MAVFGTYKNDWREVSCVGFKYSFSVCKLMIGDEESSFFCRCRTIYMSGNI